MDFSFFGDKPGEEQITILDVVDVLSGMALSVVVPTKALAQLLPGDRRWPSGTGTGLSRPVFGFSCGFL